MTVNEGRVMRERIVLENCLLCDLDLFPDHCDNFYDLYFMALEDKWLLMQ